MLDRLFELRARGTDVATEARAGLVTFLTMAYILFVNPQILSSCGMPADDVVLATALASAVACLVMGLWANFPLALAPGMGLNAYFALTVVLGLGIPWQTALAAVFVEGILFLILSVTGLRSALLAAIPMPLKLATMSGIGLFLAFIGLQNAGVVLDDPTTLVALGSLSEPGVLLAIAGTLAMTALLVRKTPGAMLFAILGVSIVAWATGTSPAPEAWASAPSLPRETLLALDLENLVSVGLVPVVLAFFFVDLLDTAGTLIGVGHLAGFVRPSGEMPGSERAFAADAIGTSVGALLGTSTVTTYVESATGVEEGGRTGLTAVVVAVMFLASLVFAPIFVAVPAIATAPALIVVGALMMQGCRDISWRRLEEGIPAFVTIALMAFTFSIANGIAAGLVTYVGVALLTNRGKEVAPQLYVVVALIGAYFVFV